MASKTFKPIIIAIILTAIITFAISYVIFKSSPATNESLSPNLNEYRKGLYSSTLCQYSCPLTLQEVQNKSQYFPDPACVENCAKNFKALQASYLPNSTDIEKDGLIGDMSNAVNTCKADSLDLTTKEMNNTEFFQCSIDKMNALKGKYSYLN
jgi:hypothetical protein